MSARSDNFNRAAATGLANPSDGGSAWIENNGQWETTAFDAARSLVSTDNLQSLEASNADVDVQYTLASAPLNLGVSARASGTNNAILLVFGSSSGVAGGVGIYRFQSGGYTLLTSDSAGNVANGDTVKLNVNGTAVAAYVNGSSRVSTTSTFNQTVTKHGLWSYNDNAYIDNFSIADVAGGTTVRPRALLTLGCGC